MRSRLSVVLVAITALALLWTVAVALGGGGSLQLGPIAFSSNDPWRPLAIALACAAIALWLSGAARAAAAGRRVVRRLTPSAAAWLLASATAIVGLAWNSWTASGPDPYAYVSQAALLREGRLHMPAPLAADAPWPRAAESFAPFGYRAAPDGSPSFVPYTSPGVPLAMAVLQMVFGHCAAFAVTPIAGGVLVLCTFGIGRQVRSPAAGLIAASLVATSPALLFMLMWPMTDVPAAAAAALAVWCLLRGSPTSALAAGLAAAAGVLIRPNFVTIVAGAALWLLAHVLAVRRGEALRRLGMFALGVVPGIVVMLWWNARLFGSPLASGYGTAGELFDWSRVAVNAGQYTRWLWDTSPLAFIGLAALVLPGAGRWSGPAGVHARWLLALVVLSAAGIYLFYLPFPEWWYLRFLLPAWPALFVAAGVAIDAFCQRWRRLRPLVLIVVLAAGLAGIAVAKRRGVFEIGATERRYVSVASLVEQNTDPASVIITWQHAGTLRYYAGRETLRFDLLDSRSLDRAIAWLAERGRHPYILVEDGERAMFDARFASHNAQGRLDYSPKAGWQSSRTPGWVFLYDPFRRDAQTVQPGPMIELAQPICAPPK